MKFKKQDALNKLGSTVKQQFMHQRDGQNVATKRKCKFQSKDEIDKKASGRSYKDNFQSKFTCYDGLRQYDWFFLPKFLANQKTKKQPLCRNYC